MTKKTKAKEWLGSNEAQLALYSAVCMLARGYADEIIDESLEDATQYNDLHDRAVKEASRLIRDAALGDIARMKHQSPFSA